MRLARFSSSLAKMCERGAQVKTNCDASLREFYDETSEYIEGGRLYREALEVCLLVRVCVCRGCLPAL